MIIVLIGPPGSGKGTQGQILTKKFNLNYLAIGDVIRKYVQNNENGKVLNEYLAQGKLIPTSFVNEIVKKFILDKKDNNSFLLDGYPRNIEQAEFLESLNQDKIKVIYFEVDEDIIIKRILGRFNCQKCGKIYNSNYLMPKNKKLCDVCGSDEFISREDDNEATIAKRTKEYMSETYPLVNFYKNKNMLYEVDGSKSQEEIALLLESFVKRV